MEIGGLVAVAATVGLLAGVVLLVARGPETLGGLFHAEQPGWPYGVQEDDDFRWRWPAGRVSAPRELEPRDPPAPVCVQPLRPEFRLCDQPRSEARARS